MLSELIKKGRVIFHDGFDRWEDAIAASCAPLLEQGVIEQAYIDQIIESVKELGPYIVIAPDICLPHAQEGAGVNESAVCFMKTQRKVKFCDDPDEAACLFFALSSIGNDEHLKNINDVVELLDDPENMKILLDAKSIDDLKCL